MEKHVGPKEFAGCQFLLKNQIWFLSKNSLKDNDEITWFSVEGLVEF